MARLEGKVAIVTGGARGLGAATVRRFAEEGARVASFDVIEAEGKALAAGVAGASFHRVDVTEEANVKEAVDAVAAEHGQLDILVNNAAIVGPNKLAHETEVADWDRTFAVNVRGPFLCTKHTVAT